MERKSFLLKVVLGLLLCSEITSIYGFGGDWSFAQYISFLLSIYVIAAIFIQKKNFLTLIPVWLSILTIDLAIVEIVTTGATLPLNSILIFLGYCVYWYFIKPSNINTYISVYKKIAVILVAFFYLQYFVHLVSGYTISGVIPYLPLNGTFKEIDLDTKIYDTGRFCSLFSEPSYLSRFVIPLIVIELFSKNSINWLLVIYLVSPIILTVTGTGAIVIIVVVSYWFICNLITRNNKRSSKIVWMSGIILLAIILLTGTGISESFFQRTEELSKDNLYGGGAHLSGYLRIWYGIDTFSRYSFYNQIFGSQNVFVIDNATMMTDFSNLVQGNFFNGISRLLLDQGYIGLILMIIFLFQIWRGRSQTGRALIICFISFMLVEAVYPGSRMSAFLALACCLDNNTAEKIHLR